MRSKRAHIIFIAAVIILSVGAGTPLAESAGGAESLELSHQLESYEDLGHVINLTYTLSVANIGTGAVTDLRFRFFQDLVVIKDEAVLEVGSLEAGSTTQISFSVESVTLSSQDEIGAFHLAWMVSGNDEAGQPFEGYVETLPATPSE